MSKLVLFTYLKQIDLHCMSALEAIRQVLGVNYVTQLRRILKWEISFETNNQEERIQWLEQLLAQSYAIVNPNKEGYYRDGIPKNESDSKIYYVGIEPKFEDRNIKEDVLPPYFVSSVKELKKTLVWEISVDRGAGNIDQNRLELDIVKTSSRKKGILVNPIHETYTFLDATVICKQ